MASNEVPVRDFLFGDDLKASLSNVDLANKLGQTLTYSNKGMKFFPANVAKNWDTNM